MSNAPVVARTQTELDAALSTARSSGHTIGFVPTMGALHKGHAALLSHARDSADVVVLSIFVNPKQFAPTEDLTKYPRTWEADVDVATRCGVDVIFAPSVETMYPAGFSGELHAGAVANELEGAGRPGHFDGVVTVVATLLKMVKPQFAVFGEKDYQQLIVVKEMVQRLGLDVAITPYPVVRDTDGMALSSRNRFLSAANREIALCLYHAIRAAQDEAQLGIVSAAEIVAAARKVLDETTSFDVAYVELRDAETFAPIEKLQRTARILIAGKLGGVRLLDNAPVFTDIRYRV